MTNKNYDVVIVGAGFSGLSAALALKKKNKSFVVLEARDRVGGRAWTKQYIDHKTGKTCWIDMGAQWIEGSQTAIRGLAQEMGIPTDVNGAPTQGCLLFIFKGEFYKIDMNSFKDKSPFNMVSFFMKENFVKDFNEYKSAEKKMDDMAECFDRGTPWKVSENIGKDIEQTQLNINRWDSMTAQSWMEENIKTDGGKFLFRIKSLLCFAAPPSDVSLLHMLHYIRCAGLSNKLNQATSFRVSGGTQSIANAVHETLKSHVRLNEPVREVQMPDPNLIKKGKSKPTLVITDNHTYSAKKVIMAIPPAIISKINFSPQLPPRRLQFNQRMPMGSSIKCHLVYEYPFWESEGYCGIAMSDRHEVPFIVNNSVPNTDGPAVLGCFVDAKKGRELINDSEEEIAKYVTQVVKEVYEVALGKGNVPEPKKVYVANWSKEEWSGGCYAGIMPPGVWTGYKNTLREPVGDIIHWATTETASKWFAYMDGAVRAGQDAANKVMES